MNKATKILALVCAMLMLVVTAAGCTATPAAEPSAEATAEATAAPETTPEATEEAAAPPARARPSDPGDRVHLASL